MACYSPWIPSGRSSKRPVACGQCIGCRLEKSRQWAVRCLHEAKLHEDSCFITLTYALEPEGSSLCYRDFQLFMKRLRSRFSDARIRFFMCGEYGEEGLRPHFHACLFGFRFPDEKQFSKALSTSATLSELWPHGFATVGRVTFESAAYVARYVVKKITGPDAEAHYAGRTPEFGQMSRRPGIGAEWLDKFWKDVFPSGEVVINGHLASAPRFYLRRFALRDPVGYAGLQASRSEAALAKIEDTFPKRLESRELVKRARLSLKARSL